MDYNNQLLSSLIMYPEINIVGVHVKHQYEKEEIKSHFPELSIYLTNDIINWNESFVTQDEIKSHYKSQIKVEHFFERYADCSSSERLAYYYSSLAFWINLFNNTCIDCVLIGQIDHGSPADTLLIDIAVEKNIPTYLFEIMLFNYDDRNQYFSIKCCNTNTYLDLDALTPDFKCIPNIDAFISSFSHKPAVISYNNDDKITLTDIYVSISYSKKIALSKVINSVLFVPKKIALITGKSFNTKEKGMKIFWKFALVYSYSNYWLSHITRKSIKNELQGHVTYAPAKKYIHGWHYVNHLRQYYQRHSVKEIPNCQKYILYALHLEPEASFMARTTYNSQLYNISMLSRSLPDGWKLYVKEHPMQFNTVKGGMYLKNSFVYRDEKYYEKICSFPNTYLLDYRISSQSLLNKNILSKNPRPNLVATINGSITLEAIINDIPTLLFDKDTLSYESPLIFGVKDQSDISACLKQIENHKIGPNDMNDIIKSLQHKLFICTPDLYFMIPDDLVKNLVLKSNSF
ncbi:MAG: hypothetical protein Q7J08_08910 [Methanocorpusculum sp.]|uniref:hypothetical protein n=1 Tax=Methanocorpusculum sp. TaxID=2058474 RepID=UPI002722372B|nr:hypothetical protein [Methanocorpusculum sp.]MDO9523811.1 hypothetical protein [Methanocorpusculum sp.]